MKNWFTFLLVCLFLTPAFAGANSGKATVDPDDAYKNNCMRCHSAVRQYSPRMTATIAMHMRVRANMTAEEMEAILQYLTDNAPANNTSVAAYGVSKRPRK